MADKDNSDSENEDRKLTEELKKINKYFEKHPLPLAIVLHTGEDLDSHLTLGITPGQARRRKRRAVIEKRISKLKKIIGK